MKIAIEGCAHGELEKIYNTIQGIEAAENIKVDLLLCCGDFQSTRNLDDLQTMAVPKKYLDICTFYKYYSGEMKAPILTIFIGGNHEASNYLQELPYGGWVAPNIYYLGYAGVVRVNGIRIAGVSGIYKGHDYLKGRHEFAPYSESTIRSVYHVRQLEVFRLKQLSEDVDIFLSHDWPRGIYNYGNKAQLVRFKPHFRDEVDNNQLGSRPCEDLLQIIKPSYWFAAHLHCQFAAVVPHGEPSDEEAPPQQERITKFLALDKCLPKRRFLQILDIETDDVCEGDLRFEYDSEWLAILFLTNHLTNVKNANYYLPASNNAMCSERYDFTPSPEELQHVQKKFDGDLRIPKNFCRTVEAFNPHDLLNANGASQPKAQINPQSILFCDTLGIDDPLSLAMIIGGHELSLSSTLDGSDAAASDSCSILIGETSLNSTGFIDSTTPIKRKSSLGLNLPKPNIDCDEEILSPEDDLCKKQNSSDVELVEPIISDEVLNQTESDAKPPIKKLKRRNQDIYNPDNDNN